MMVEQPLDESKMGPQIPEGHKPKKKKVWFRDLDPFLILESQSSRSIFNKSDQGHGTLLTQLNPLSLLVSTFVPLPGSHDQTVAVEMIFGIQ